MILKASNVASLAFKVTRRTTLLKTPILPCNALVPRAHEFHTTLPQRFDDGILHQAHALINDIYSYSGLPWAVLQTHTLIEGVHSYSGLPWAATVPLLALTFRGVFLFPLSMYQSRWNRKFFDLAPQVEEIKASVRQQVQAAKELAGKPSNYKEAVIERNVAIWSLKFYKRHGYQRWKNHMLKIETPVLLLVLETLRQMCGSGDSLLGLVAKSLTGGTGESPGTHDGSMVPMEPSLMFEGML